MKKVLGLIVLLSLTACGPGFQAIQMPTPTLEPQDDWIVKARAYMTITVDKDSQLTRLFNLLILPKVYAASGTQPVTVVVSSNTQFALSGAGFSVPASTSTDTLNFGSLVITNLRDNNLKVCGGGGNQKCTQAVLRIYTTGVGGNGLWNPTDSYGAPLSAQLGSNAAQVFNLNAAGAANMQTLTIPSNKNVIHLSDFSPAPSYSISSDFSNAGAGSFSTTIVVEYAVQ